VLGITSEDAITALGKLLDEAETMSSQYRSPMFQEQLKLWTKRSQARLRDWGLHEEATRLETARGPRVVGIDEATFYYDMMQARQ